VRPCEGRLGLTPALFRAADACEAKLESVLATLGLSLPKFHVLDHLVQAGTALPLGELAARNACVKSNMTALIDRLEGDGLVVRSQDPSDRRSVRAQLTPAGAERHAEASRLLEAEERAVVDQFTARERQDLETLLERLATVRT
jgi:MarR family transcriptional regulator, 2-MHQ and catechol-resistance regulon repressor